MTTLLDANVLIALVVVDHVHHDPAESWFANSLDRFAHHDPAESWFANSLDRFATCPITEGSLVRLLIREGQTADTAQAVRNSVRSSERYEFWADSIAYSDVPVGGILGHRQVADAYQAQLARANRGRLATLRSRPGTGTRRRD